MRRTTQGRGARVSTVIAGRAVVLSVRCPHCGADERNDYPLGFRRDGETASAFAERLRQAATQLHFDCEAGAGKKGAR